MRAFNIKNFKAKNRWPLIETISENMVSVIGHRTLPQNFFYRFTVKLWGAFNCKTNNYTLKCTVKYS